MPVYAAEFLDQAKRDLRQLDTAVVGRIRNRLRWLCSNLDSTTPEALTGNLAGLFKLRAGDYRVLYEIIRSERKIIIHSVGHRRDVYRRQ
jgi:mRNA interferase RelE/StbE